MGLGIDKSQASDVAPQFTPHWAEQAGLLMLEGIFPSECGTASAIARANPPGALCLVGIVVISGAAVRIGMRAACQAQWQRAE